MQKKALPMLRAVTLAALVTLAGWAPGTFAQDANNEYYASRGTKLLATVEQYHLYPGEEKFRQRNFKSAFDDMEFILRYFPNHPNALLLMVQICSEWKAARCSLDNIFDNALALKPDAAGTYVVKGIYLHRVKRYSDAIESYRRALALDPRSLNAHYNIALSFLETRQPELANRHAQAAYALGAQLPGLRNRLQQSGQWNTAVDPLPGIATKGTAGTEPSASPGPDDARLGERATTLAR